MSFEILGQVSEINIDRREGLAFTAYLLFSHFSPLRGIKCIRTIGGRDKDLNGERLGHVKEIIIELPRGRWLLGRSN